MTATVHHIDDHPSRRSLRYSLYSDPYVSGKHGFEIRHYGPGDVKGVLLFDSGLEYSSRADAEQAAMDACLAAELWAGHYERLTQRRHNR